MNDDPTPDQDVSQIIAAAAAQQQREVPDAPAIEVTLLAERLNLLVADFGRWSEYKAASAEYIAEFTAELRWHRRLRLAVAIACLLVVIGLAALLVTALWRSDTLFGADGDASLTALIVACVSGIVVITIAALRGAFSSLKDRNDGLPMPEQMKQLVEVGQNLFGKS